MAETKAVTPADVRAWAREQGIDVGNRGRLSAELVDAHNKANPRRKYERPA